jgi:pimeloyl-ACP methyl ester carboxylesterase
LNKDIKYRIILGIGLVLVIFPLTIHIVSDYRLRGSSSQFVIDGYGNKLYTKYYPSKWHGVEEYVPGVMLFHGMGEDQNSLRIYTHFLRKFGFHVFTVDFSGHGRSSGVIPSGELGADILAHQVNRARETFKLMAGLSDHDLFMIGHSMGARAILKATQIASPVNGCVLIGSAIDVDNVSNDSWINELGPDNPDSNMLILTGAWDDVQPPQNALRLYQKLTGNDTLSDLQDAYRTPNGNRIQIYVFKAMTHTHESMSIRMAYAVSDWIEDRYFYDGTIRPADSVLKINFIDFYIWFSILEIVGFFLLLVYGQKTIKYEQEKRAEIRNNNEQKNDLINPKHYYLFYIYKLGLWFGAFGIALLLGIILIYLPISIPYFSLIFICPIVGYGVVNILLYRFGKMPRMTFKWKPEIRGSFKNLNVWDILFGLAAFGLITVAFSYLINNLVYHIFPLNIRLAWLAISTILGTLGFYIFQFEMDLLRKAYPNQNKYTVLNNLVFVLPFVIGALVILFSGRIIFFIDAIHDLIIIGLVILVGNLLQQIWKKPILTAFMQSFLLFFLLLPRGQMTFM